jgi:uncharacterized membrane protein YeaQ/YmgE (transglycosylase-associated protein family)
MDLLVMILLGGIAGWIASMLMGAGGGLVWNIVMGIVGAVIGGFIMNALGQPGVTGFNLYSIIVAVIGAAVAILSEGFCAGQRNKCMRPGH